MTSRAVASPLLAATDPAMVVVTTADAHERAGCLVGFHSQAGIEPVAVAVWLSKANHTFRVATMADVLAVHYLERDDLALASLFGSETGDEVDKFAQVSWTPGLGGVPLLDDCVQRIVGRKTALLDAGADHVCVLLDPVAATHVAGFTPMRLHQVEHLSPGHSANERPVPPTTAAV